MVKEIYLAGGCFWGTEHYFKQIRGVISTEVGYANGTTLNPTYEEVYTDTTGYAETVHIAYDAEVVELRLLLEMFFRSIDPTSLNQQGEDCGTRYRTGIYYTDEKELPVIQQALNELSSKYDKPIRTELLPLENFTVAEQYHQDYLIKNPEGYCHIDRKMFDIAKNYRKS